jgi:iron(III) transport system substrate-binding protein
MAFAPSDVDFQPIVTSVVAAYGRQKTVAWLQAMKSTAGDHAYPDDEAVESAVNQGRVAFGVINEYYWLRFHGDAAAKNARIVTFAAHDPGYVLFVAGAAALASSKHPREAQQFLAFLTTPEAQKIVATAGIEYPLAQPTLGTGPLGRPFTSLAPNPIDVDRLGDGSLAIALLRQAGLI